MTPPRRPREATARSSDRSRRFAARNFARIFAAQLEAKVREKQASWAPQELAEMVEAASALRQFATTGDETRLLELARS